MKSCSTVDDTSASSNDNNISSLTASPATQPGGCQTRGILDNLVHFSVSLDDGEITTCGSDSPELDPAVFKTLQVNVTGQGAQSPNAGVRTSIPGPPMVRTGTQLACAGATIHLTPWDGDACDGIEFDAWHGACAGSGACAVRMTDDRTVVAKFRSHDCGRGQVWDSSACGCVAGR